MKIILLQNIKGFGRIGDVKNVSDGHARNFLFPKKLAKLATESGLKEVSALQQKRDVMNLKDKESVKKAVATLAETVIEFKKKASPTGTLFSSVNKEEIAKEVSNITGVRIDANMVNLGDLGEHIKHLGEHEALIELGHETKAPVKLLVKPE